MATIRKIAPVKKPNPQKEFEERLLARMEAIAIKQWQETKRKYQLRKAK